MVSEQPKFRDSDAERVEEVQDPSVVDLRSEVFALMRGAMPNNGLQMSDRGFEPIPKRHRFSRGKKRY